MTALASIETGLIEKRAELAFGYLGGAIASGMIYLGDRMGLYRALVGAGPVTSQELADRTGLSERWLREWLQQQAAADILDYRGEGRFELTEEGRLLFVDEANPASVIGLFGELPSVMGMFDRLPKAFRTGIGYTYDDGGPAMARTLERELGPWNRSALIDEALPKVGDVVAKLEAGVKVADVGCGAAAAIVALGQRFPKSEFHGYDNSLNALRLAHQAIHDAGVTNVFVHDSDVDRLPEEPTFDIVLTLDCLHDMTRPDLAAAAIRKAIKPEGTWFIVDVDCKSTFEENMENPLAPMLYGFSVMLCMSSSASSKDGMALGTVGLPEPKMQELVEAAGFRSFARVPGLTHPFNAYYEAHP